MFLSLKANQDKLATTLGMGSAIAATVGAIGVAAAMFSPFSVVLGIGSLAAAVLATEASSKLSK